MYKYLLFWFRIKFENLKMLPLLPLKSFAGQEMLLREKRKSFKNYNQL
jgi:hypothetical protein